MLCRIAGIEQVCFIHSGFRLFSWPPDYLVWVYCVEFYQQTNVRYTTQIHGLVLSGRTCDWFVYICDHFGQSRLPRWIPKLRPKPSSSNRRTGRNLMKCDAFDYSTTQMSAISVELSCAMAYHEREICRINQSILGEIYFNVRTLHSFEKSELWPESMINANN